MCKNDCRWLRVILAVFIICVVPLAGCRSSNAQPFDIASVRDYRDIPGVTAEEIAAVETLKDARVSFTYAHLLETEAFEHSNGKTSGFTIMLSELMTELFGITFQSRLYNDWAQLKEAVDTRAVDFSGEFAYTPERMAEYYMSNPVTGHTMHIYTLKGDNSIVFDTDVNGKRLGFWYGSVLEDIIRASYPSLVFESVYLDGYDAAADMLYSGELDAFVAQDVSREAFDAFPGLQARPFFTMAYTAAAITTADPALKPVLSVFDKYLNAGGTQVLYEMHEKSRDEYAIYKFFQSLTEDELAWLNNRVASGQTVNVGYETENYPVCFYNKREKVFQGVALDVLDKISRLTGLTFVSASGPDARWPDIMDKLKSGEVSLTAELLYTDARSGAYIWSSEPYATTHYALLSKIDYPRLQPYQLVWANVGTIRGTAHEEAYYQNFPGHKSMRFDTMAEAFDALDNGTIDLLMMSEHALLAQTHYLEKTGYIVNIRLDKPQHSYFGFNKDETMLHAIMDKAQAQVDTAVIADCWVSRTYDYEFELAQMRADYLNVLAVTLFCILLMVLGLLLANRRLSDKLSLRETQLVKAVASAEAASRAKTAFLANMSHELRTPLNSIVGFSNLAMEAGVSARAREYLENVRTNSDVLLQIIDDVLDISKLDAGRIELESVPFRLTEVTGVCRTVILPKALDKGIRLQFNIACDTGILLLGDSTRLRQALLNLLSNAVKFTDRGVVTLSVSAEDAAKDSVSLCFEVCDSGIGISQELVKHVFEPFRQADDSMTRRYGGTGLGLTITQRIVDLMGGTLTVDSTLGVGSRFSFTLQFPMLSETDASIGEPPPIGAGRPVFTGEALVCEDNAMNQQVAAAFLVRAGLKPVIANDGLEGLSLVKQRIETGTAPFDIIFMDIHMPVMDGLNAARNIKTLGCKTPIVAMTASIIKNDLEAYRQNGMPDYLAKPFKTRALWDCLHKYLTPIGYTAESDNDRITTRSNNKKLLRMFVSDHSGDADVIREALHQGDTARAYRVAHTLKTVSLLIGYTALSEAAAAVENALRADSAQEVSPVLINTLEEALRKTLAELAERQEYAPVPAETAAAEEGLFERLNELLAQNDCDSLDYIHELRALPGTEVLVEQLERYDFDLARQTLRELMRVRDGI